MASLRIIKRRIKSAKNISQVTRALQMVSAVKMRKSQETATASRPYAMELKNVLQKLSGKIEQDVHPFLNQREVISKVTVVVIGPDKGLAGALITNLARKVFTLEDQARDRMIFPDEQHGNTGVKLTKDAEVSAISWGKKTRDILSKTKMPIKADFSIKNKESLAVQISALGNLLSGSYLAGETDLVMIVYSNFVNTVTQKPLSVQFLPMTVSGIMEGNNETKGQMIKFEPSPKEVLSSLLEHYLKTILSQIILDSLAAEHSARMVAMKNASDNAKDIIKYLTLSYNQTRQTAITNEIADIVSGSLMST